MSLRSIFGPKNFKILSIMLCFSLFHACTFIDKVLFPPLFENEPEDGTWILSYGYECYINGEKMADTLYYNYARWKYIRGYDVTLGYHSPFQSAFFVPDYYLKHKKDGPLPEVDYNHLAFYFQLSSSNDKYPLWDGKSSIGVPLFFYIPGDGENPFIAGKDYSSPNNCVFYYPALFGSVQCGPDGPLYLNGLEVTLLYSSFKFDYSLCDNPGGWSSEALDFYFAFEELINRPPDGYTTPQAGDTISVTQGHLTISLLLEDIDRVHQYVAP